MTASSILTVNGGSSSLKCGLFTAADRPELIKKFSITNESGDPEDLVDSLNDVLEQLRGDGGDGQLLAIGHRVVHGGDLFDNPVILNADVISALQGLAPLAPLHQPINLQLIETCAQGVPGIPQVACFDTAFHRHMPAVARNYALPRNMTDAGVHAYGFHGLSYEFIWERLQELDERAADKRIIIAHLGAGASMCAIKDGKSIATTMGFSTAEGLPMETRTGSIDPGVLIHLIREHDMDADDLERLIYKESGLRGMSGEPGGMLELQASRNPHARDAIDYFVYRIVCEIGSLTAALTGLDILVFTGGIGTNDASIRQQITDQLTWLDDELDIRVIPANEEAMIASHTIRVLNNAESGNRRED